MATLTTDLPTLRQAARIVAYIELACWTVALAYTVYILVLGVGTIAVISTYHDEIKEEMEMDNITPTDFSGAIFFLWIMWISIVITVIIVFTNYTRAVIKLFKATKKGENEIKSANYRAAIWSGVYIGFLHFIYALKDLY